MPEVLSLPAIASAGLPRRPATTLAHLRVLRSSQAVGGYAAAPQPKGVTRPQARSHTAGVEEREVPSWPHSQQAVVGAVGLQRRAKIGQPSSVRVRAADDDRVVLGARLRAGGFPSNSQIRPVFPPRRAKCRRWSALPPSPGAERNSAGRCTAQKGTEGLRRERRAAPPVAAFDPKTPKSFWLYSQAVWEGG